MIDRERPNNANYCNRFHLPPIALTIQQSPCQKQALPTETKPRSEQRPALSREAQTKQPKHRHVKASDKDEERHANIETNTSNELEGNLSPHTVKRTTHEPATHPATRPRHGAAEKLPELGTR